MKNIEYDIWCRMFNSCASGIFDDIVRDKIQRDLFNRIRRRIEHEIVVVDFTDEGLILLNFD